jgi:hypothetical protein
MVFLWSPPSAENDDVHDEIQGKHDGAKHHLQAAVERGRVHDGNEVALDKACRVAGAAAGAAEGVFERRQRTDPTEEFDRGAPRRRRQMNDWREAPPERKEAAEQHEHDEHDVKEEDEIRQAPIQHRHQSGRPEDPKDLRIGSSRHVAQLEKIS